MKNKNEVEAFMYIPDMTGFTEFMTNTNPEESTQIVEETLKGITAANILNLKISDIVGDAVFFYKLGSPPSLSSVIEQSRVITEKFHDQIKAYGSKYNWETNRVEQVHQLDIKFIAHYGPVGLTSIEDHVKLIGVPAIEAHRLLKNSVAIQNYLLATEAFLQATGFNDSTFNVTDGSDTYEHIGEVRYKVINLKSLPAPVDED